MNRDTAYQTTIPPESTPKRVGKYRNGRTKRIEYFMGNELVGRRLFSYDGDMEMEYSWLNGKSQGWCYRWDSVGELLSATPYVNGVEHGTAYQWAKDGRLIGTYTMEHGTGIDLRWNELTGGAVALTEAYEMVNGKRQGYEWSFYNCVPWQLSYEKQWFEGNQHGIERDWNLKGGMRRGWPQYWIHGDRVDKRKYLRATAKDPTLPLFRSEDNSPIREFSAEVARQLNTTRM